MKNLEYLNPYSTQTLREGIAELRAAEGADGDAAQNIAPELAADIDVHDAIHVVFACPTNLIGEISAHVWTLFGTTMKVADMHRVNMHEDHRTVLADIGHRRLLKTWFQCVPQTIRTFLRTFRLKSKWPAEDYTSFFDQRLCDIREQFNIILPNRPSTKGKPSGAALRYVRSRHLASS